MITSSTRMHSSRMRTGHSSAHLVGVSTRAPWDRAPPPGPGTPGTRYNLLFPPPDQAPPRLDTPPVNRMTDACENITLPQLLTCLVFHVYCIIPFCYLITSNLKLPIVHFILVFKFNYFINCMRYCTRTVQERVMMISLLHFLFS